MWRGRGAERSGAARARAERGENMGAAAEGTRGWPRPRRASGRRCAAAAAAAGCAPHCCAASRLGDAGDLRALQQLQLLPAGSQMVLYPHDIALGHVLVPAAWRQAARALGADGAGLSGGEERSQGRPVTSALTSQTRPGPGPPRHPHCPCAAPRAARCGTATALVAGGRRREEGVSVGSSAVDYLEHAVVGSSGPTVSSPAAH